MRLSGRVAVVPVGLRGPNAAAGLRGPNAAAGLRGPNAAAGLRGPNAAAGLRGPNAAIAAAARTHALVMRLADEGATIVLVDDGGEDAGQLAAAIEARGTGRPAVFTFNEAGDGDDGEDLDALVEFVAEIFRPAS